LVTVVHIGSPAFVVIALAGKNALFFGGRLIAA
jgi:hypothetical protein